MEHRAEAGDAALHLALDQQIGRGKSRAADGRSDGRCWRCCSPSRPRYGHCCAWPHRSAGRHRKRAVRQDWQRAVRLRQRGSRHGLRGCSRRSCAGRTDAQCLLEPAGKLLPRMALPEALQLESASEAAAAPVRRRTVRRVIFIGKTSCKKTYRRGPAECQSREKFAGAARGRTLPGSKNAAHCRRI